jgi:hypothetical protein
VGAIAVASIMVVGDLLRWGQGRWGTRDGDGREWLAWGRIAVDRGSRLPWKIAPVPGHRLQVWKEIRGL